MQAVFLLALVTVTLARSRSSFKHFKRAQEGQGKGNDILAC